ncbi:MAG: vitamin B12 dependent-methionine synthase activation domain-containing protein [Gammaproteobacteria bacterium]|jgi:5-methyltetrahydrofolate--homocysteine methyltransferase|nr:vitamin B12 dependent-methionine synthase activation domain-containing protein [Gammaproteobacteria bacterium]
MTETTPQNQDDEKDAVPGARWPVTDNPVPVPPFFGSRCLERVPLRAVLPYINRRTLYRFQWGFKAAGRGEAEYQAWARTEVDPIFNRIVERAEREDIIRPAAVYGYFPCQSDGDELIVYDPEDQQRERCRFRFPRQTKGRGLCIADFFRPVGSGTMDVVAFQVATVGQHASDVARALFAADQYQEYLYLHGLNVETTESLAEFVHKRIRAELGFAREDARSIADMLKQGYRGSRYSFGYPACPELADQDKILDLLDAERIGVVLGDEFQLWPEESTSAIVVHHPQAKYFSA